MNYTGFVFIAVGIFSVFCSIKDYDWFMEHRKARLLVKLLKRNGARIFYTVLGTGLIVFGGLYLSGVIK
jgi:hypothetical protein